MLALSATVSKTYPEPVGTVLWNFHIDCQVGEIVALLGPSGCGKSTLLNLLASLIEPDSLSDLSTSNILRQAKSDFAYAFQRAELVPWRNCEENVYHETDVLGRPRIEIRSRIERLLKVTGLSAYRSLLPSHLSIGMQQRLQLARVGARGAKLVLLDEPLGAVDQPLRVQIAQDFRGLFQEDGSAAIWVTHDSLEAVTVADRVLVLGGKPLKVVTEHRVERGEKVYDPPGLVEDPTVGPKSITLDAQAAKLRQSLLSVYSDVTERKEQTNEKSRILEGTYVPQPSSTRRLGWLFPVIPSLLILLIWQIVVLARPSLKFFLSAPSEWIPQVFTELVGGTLPEDIRVTLRETIFGLGIGLPLGVAVGFLASQSRRTSAAIRPYLVGLTAVPLFVLAPAFILWFGIGEAMKVAIAALSCFPFVGYLVHDAALEAKGAYYRYLVVAGAERSRLFLHLVLPSTFEGILRSIRPAAVAALIGAFLGEFIAANKGLGYYIVFQASRYRVPEVFVGVFILFLVAIVIDSSSRWLANRRTKIIAWLGI